MATPGPKKGRLTFSDYDFTNVTWKTVMKKSWNKSNWRNCCKARVLFSFVGFGAYGLPLLYINLLI